MAEKLTNNFFDVVEDIFKKYEIANKGKELNKDLKTGTTLMSHSDFIPELASKYNLTEKETEDLIMIVLDNQVIDDDIPYMVSRNTFKDGSNVADSVKKYINGEKIIIDKTNYFHPQHKIFGGTYQRKLPDTPTNVVDDTPTNVVDDLSTLNTDLVWEKDRIQRDANPKWNDGIVKNNNILKPDLKNSDIKKIIPQIIDGSVSDVNFTKFGIWLLHNSPEIAFGAKTFSSEDAIADVVKIVIFNGKNPNDLINKNNLETVKNSIGFNSITSDIGLSDELILQFGREEGPFVNAQQRIKQTIINEHNKLYANADDYFILFRGGALTDDPVQSFSKDGAQAHYIGYQTNQATIRQGGRGIDAYFVNKNDFIDLQSLGLDYGSEAEVIVYKEGVNKPIQKTVMDESIREFNYLDKDRLKFIEDNWNITSSELPKEGFIVPDTPTNVVDDYITALKQEAGKYNTFDEYEKAFSREYKRGIYYHLTDNPNFVVDLSKGATDAATGKMTPGSIMFTTDLDYWADTTWTDRPYVAILDLSDVDESQFTQVNRGEGNEFYLDDASNVKVKEVIPVDEALKRSELIKQWGLDNLKNKEDLKKVIWDNRPDTPGGSLSGGSLGAAKLNDQLVFDSWVDNLGRTTASFVDNLPLETVVKNRIKNLITTKTKQLTKPGSLLVKAVDAWEFGVIGLMAAGIAFNEIDEVPTIINNTAINMFNSMTVPYGIAPVAKEEYEIDYEFINTVLDTGSKVMPTDIIIEKLKPYSLKEGEDVILPGTGVTATTGAEQQFEPYGEELAKRAEKTVNMKRDEVKQKILESKGVQEEKMFKQAKPKKSKATGGAGAKIL